MSAPSGPVVAIAMKGYPRLSETFIAQELLGLQQRGLPFAIWSLRQPTDVDRHLMHRQITAPVSYLPEYLHDQPGRVWRGALSCLRRPALARLAFVFLRDLARDPTRNRLRRLGQALVMARELPESTRHLHVHYLHTPASVIRYAAVLRGLSWSFSAHAKDIWTTPDWEKREKIAAAEWGATCTRDGHGELQRLADRNDKVALVYHGLELSRFPEPPTRPGRDGSDPADPVRFATIGRAVEKKGFDDLLAALAMLPADLHWRLTHIGGGEKLAALKQQAEALGLSGRVNWAGPKAQAEVIETLRAADLFVLPSILEALPTVAVEALACGTPVVSTDNPGGLELNGVFGPDVSIVPGEQPIALAKAISAFLRDKRRTLDGTREAIEREFRPAAVAAQYWDIYAELTGAAGAGIAHESSAP